MKVKKSDKTNKKTNKRNIIKLIRNLFVSLMLVAVVTVLVCNLTVLYSADDYIINAEKASELEDVDCIIVLGAGLQRDGTPSFVLRQRLDCGISLYGSGVSDRILVSGDHSRIEYNEVGSMKSYMSERGIEPNVIFTDHAGFDTYDTFYRAKEVFKAKRVVIVTQNFHLSRAVFIARELGLEAWGVASDAGASGGIKNETREIFARVKYAFDAIFKPEPKFLGEAIPIWGDASASDG